MATDLVIDAKLSKESYGLNNSDKSLDIDGWRTVYVPGFVQTSANFAAQLFVAPDGSYKIGYRGTANLFSSGDTTTNVQSIVLNKWTQELTDSIEFTHAALKYIANTKGTSYGEARGYLSLTGHSQGGFESEVNAKFFGLKGTSLDGPGASTITQTQEFIDLKDRLSTGREMGTFYFFSTTALRGRRFASNPSR